MTDAELPEWLFYLRTGAQALGIPCIAGLAAWIAHRQMRLAELKLKHDLFDRKFTIFDAARTFIREVVIKGGAISVEDLAAFGTGTAEAIFLLDPRAVDYIDHLGKQAERLHICLTEITHPEQAADLNKAIREKWDLIQWFAGQPRYLVEVFRPFLDLTGNKELAPPDGQYLERIAGPGSPPTSIK